MTGEDERQPVETGGPQDRLLPWNQVRDVTGLSRSTAWRLQRIGDFPEPVRISINRVGWWESELTAWKETRKSRRPERPRSLQPPRAPKLIETVRSSRPVADQPTPVKTITPTKPLSNPPTRKRRRPVVHVDQIDFGF
ncbi:helix-turn-helix transcriptional regulator [Brevundimonas sp.]|uniref:helix-turn-helix transcriptional regulator n=1 Tax=Brevundimonas sp. TaxID=1871086 RepID=UPI003D6C7544